MGDRCGWAGPEAIYLDYHDEAGEHTELPKAVRERIEFAIENDLIPGNLELMEFEHDTPRALAQGNAGLFFFRVREALDQVEQDYDVVVIDCPPQLGFLTMSALSASTGVLVTIHPEMLDVMSMSQFLRMTADLMDVIAQSGADMSHDWMRYLLTRYEPTDAPQNRVVAFLRTMYGDKVLNATMLKSTDAPTLQRATTMQTPQSTTARALCSTSAAFAAAMTALAAVVPTLSLWNSIRTPPSTTDLAATSSCSVALTKLLRTTTPLPTTTMSLASSTPWVSTTVLPIWMVTGTMTSSSSTKDAARGCDSLEPSR